MRFFSETGQSTVEAAVLLPAIFALLGLLLQPGFLLYNRCVMNAAASEGCRLIATSTCDDASIRAFLERRLAGIPKIKAFHADESWELSWQTGLTGSSVSIVNHAKPLPLFGIVAGLGGGTMTSDGLIEQRVEASSALASSWVGSAGDPASWIGAWK